MKFKLKDFPNDGDIKVTTKFLFLPKWIGLEIRWLEVATFKSIYCERKLYQPSRWVVSEWVDK